MALAASERYMDEVAATSPSRAAVVLYDEAIAALKAAIASIGGDNVEGRSAAIGTATEAVTTLYLNLDVKRSGEIADNLANLYGYVLGRLMRINLYSDPGIAEELIGLLEPLRDSWVDLDGVMATANSSIGKANGNGRAKTKRSSRKQAASPK